MKKEKVSRKVKTFKDLIVWQKSHQLFLDIVEDIESLPNKRVAWIIADQILRSSSSISANISEGFGRKTRADYEHFFIIARGSTTETQNWLIKCKDLNYIIPERFEYLDEICVEIIKMLNGLIGSLRRKSTPSLNP
ncbi:MAG: four helix bundle protein [Thermodesulfobacteriota bacterium]|nr:four helix bundle protein [Thermodesulfobacteriota bacterium]